MQVVAFREGDGMSGWGQEGYLCGDVPFLILAVVSNISMFTLSKVAELNN